MNLDESDSSDHEDSSVDVNDILGEMQTHESHLQRQASLATIDVAYTPDGEEVDIDTFKENCWDYICSAQKEGGIAELASKVAAADAVKDGAAGGDSANSIKVGVRTRPINDREIRLGTRGCIEHLSDNQNIIVRKYNWNDEPYDMTFAFDHAFDEDSTQDEVFKAMGWTALRNAFSGYNVSIFAYGQTGSGKSHSMIGTDDDPGLIRRIGEFLFDFIERGEQELGYEYSATVSAAEIYCENVRDLLVFMGGPNGSGGKNGKKPPKRMSSLTSRLLNSASTKAERMNRELSADSEAPTIQYDKNGNQMLKIREGKDGVYVEGQSKVQIRSMAEMSGIIFAAIENRMVRATNMNADSSRSHLIFCIEFTQTQVSATTGRQSIVKSKINLIDLAGSERARSTGSSGAGLREGANINKSLSTLGRVISSLAEGKSRDHVPYRDSKLTYILKDSLGGDSKTAMLATISPAESNYDETVSTLRYAASVKRIKTSASQHLEQEAGEMIEKLRAEVDALAQELKNQEIQAEALAEEHRLALEELEKSRPTKVVKDDREVAKLKAELGAMSKRAERYRTERDVGKKELEAMEKRADRYRKERKVADDKVRQLEKDLAKAEKAVQEKITAAPQPKPILIERRIDSIPEPATPTIPAAVTAEMKRLNERVKELEELVAQNAGLGDDVVLAMKDRRETGSHLSRMSLELESTTLEKLKLEEKLKKRSEQMKDPLAVMSMGFSSMFGAAIGSSVPEGSDGESEKDEDEVIDVIEDDERGISSSIDPDRANNIHTSANSSFDAGAAAEGSIVATGGVGGGGRATRKPAEAKNNVLIDSLRHQLEDSNSLNEALEKKISDQTNTMRKLSESLAALQNSQSENNQKALGEGEANAAIQKATWDKANKEIADLAQKLMEAEAKVEHDTSVKKHLESRLAESEKVEAALRSAKDELMLAKDNAEDELRSLGAQRAEDNRIAAEKLELAEQMTAKVEKSRAKLERELEKLQKRHAELRAASKRLLAEKMEKKANSPPPQRPEDKDGAEGTPSTSTATSAPTATPAAVAGSKEAGAARSRSPRPVPPNQSQTPPPQNIANTSFQPASAPPSRKGASPSRTRSPRAAPKESSVSQVRASTEGIIESGTTSALTTSTSANGVPARSRAAKLQGITNDSVGEGGGEGGGEEIPTAPKDRDASPRPKPVNRDKSPRSNRSPSASSRARPSPKSVKVDKVTESSEGEEGELSPRSPRSARESRDLAGISEAPSNSGRRRAGEKSVERKRAPRPASTDEVPLETKTETPSNLAQPSQERKRAPRPASTDEVPLETKTETPSNLAQPSQERKRAPRPTATSDSDTSAPEKKETTTVISKPLTTSQAANISVSSSSSSLGDEEVKKETPATSVDEDAAAELARKRAEREKKLREAKEKSNKIKLEREAKALEAQAMELAENA